MLKRQGNFKEMLDIVIYLYENPSALEQNTSQLLKH
jgi:hypothetical protein